ncbi:MAG: ASCH domain-containing protein [Desulfovibrionaceae bacterium]
MKALSIPPIWAKNIADGEKIVECRSWQAPSIIGKEIIVCSTGKIVTSQKYTYLLKHALCVVPVLRIEKFSYSDFKKACMEIDNKFLEGNYFAWHLGEVRYIEPFPVKGQLNLFSIDLDPQYISYEKFLILYEAKLPIKRSI